jgi:MFS family permease
VYPVTSPIVLLRGRGKARERATGSRVSRTVVLLGLTSLFTDISSEMVSTVLPLYLVFVGGFSPLAFGVVDGLYNGAAALVGLASGFAGDRWRRHKEVAATGYGLSALCKLLLVLAGTAVSAIGAIILIDRAGKGIRTAPRDAMISLSTEPSQLGAAFGVHRALDTVGAMIGPLLAFALLAMIPLGFHTVFIVSFLIALVGLGIITLFVPPSAATAEAAPDDAAEAEDAADAEPAKAPSLKAAFGLLQGSRYRGILIAGAMLSLATVSDAFIFLALQDELHLATSAFPLLYVGSSMVYVLLATPIGRLADRVGRGRVLVVGYATLLVVYAALLGPLGGWPLLVVVLGLLGAYYAATDGVLMAFGSTAVPDEVRGSGLALLGTATNIAKFVASVAFGALWTIWGSQAALACFFAALVVAAVMAGTILVRTSRAVHV